jgi:transcriptional regulator with XRE-family HTH domain
MTPASTTSLLAFGALLKRSRRAARLTQAQLAERAGFSVVYISKLERGARQPQRTTVALLAEALDFSSDERVALESAAQLPSGARAVGRHAAREAGSETGTLRLPIGGFLGAVPAGPLVGHARELAVIQEALEEAFERIRAMPYAEAKALWVYGRLEVARGDPAAARERFTAALTICDRLGEGLYRTHIAHDLAALQSPTGPASP